MFGVFLTDSKHITCVYGGLNITEEVDDYRDILITLELSKDGLKRDGITIMTFDNAEFTSSCELIVGTMNTADQLDSRYFMGTVYSIDLWQGEEQRLHLVPCVDEQVKPCFYNILTDSTYQNSGFNEFEFEDENLEYDKSSYIEEVPIKKLNSAAFRQYGFDDFPRNVIFSKLTNPVLYHWQNTDIDLPENARKAQDQEEYQKKYNELVTRYETAKNRYDELVYTIEQKKAQSEKIQQFIGALKSQNGFITEFDEALWSTMADFITVGKENCIVTFRDGTEMKI